MDRRKRYAVVILAIIAILIASFLVYRDHMATTPRYGVVQMETVIQANPHYKSYEEALQRYEDMKKQYHQEEANNNEKDRYYQMLSAKSMDDEGLRLTLQRIYEAKMNLRRIQLNGELEREYRKLIAQYSKEMPPQKKVNLEIVNLQLELESLGIYTAEEKKEKEDKLHQLLVKSDPSLAANNEWLIQKVEKAMIPKQKAAKEQLRQYEEMLIAELREKGIDRDSLIMATAQSNSSEAKAMIWNKTWQIKLEAQKLIVERAYAKIVSDIREKVAEIAKQENLSIVITKCEYGRGAIDITQRVIDSYR